VKIFDEILVNAIDQWSLHPKKVTEISVRTEGSAISVKNSGVCVPIKKHETEKGPGGAPLWIPELIFGHLLTSSNYNDEEERVTGGRNGYGAKLTNVFSKRFWVEITDGKKRYTQVWHDNMSRVEPPEMAPSASPPSVTIGFVPDWARFGTPADDPAFLDVVEKRTWDAALWCAKAKVSYNGTHLQVPTLEAFAQMHVGVEPLVSAKCGAFEIVVGHSDSGAFQQVSFVNGIATTKGGTHVDKVTKSLTDAILSTKGLSVRPAQVKAALFVFVRAVIINPTFSSQTKAECTSKISDPIDFKPKFIKDLLATGVLADLQALGAAAATKELKKTDGTKKSRVTGVPKLDDANWAGTHRSAECTLIVTEGDSAKALAIAGLSVVGRNSYGVFPLRGKPRNVRDASVKQVTDNEEFSAIKKILGLQHGKIYTNLCDLRYGRLMIMTDADLDGSHIKGLVLNMFHVYWPQLIELGFVVSMVTPVIKAGKVWYFSEESYRQSLATDAGGASPKGPGGKYYKGLGTSTSEEAREYFRRIAELTVAFTGDAAMNESMVLAFAKSHADNRKGWLTTHMAAPPPGIPYGKVQTLGVTDFVHRDLANFSAEDIKRSIPHVVDGLKPSQRKVIYACLKKNLTQDMKVAQLAGYIAEHTAYHHGEASLQGTIVNLAQNFVGANNLNLLEPSGQFGTRLAGGKDAASARYIFTRLNPVTKKVFDPADNPVLKYVVDDGQTVEPEFYAPVVPMILVNGAEGIGTGFSCYVPPFDYDAVRQNIVNLLDQKPTVPMVPHFKGFKGAVKQTKEHTWVLEGVVQGEEGCRWHVTELPPGKWISGAWEDPVKELGLTKTIHTSNMHLIAPNGAVKHYASPEEILVDYVEVRLGAFKRRKAWQLAQLDTEIQWLTEKARFIGLVTVQKFVVFNASKVSIEEQFKANAFAADTWPKLLDIKTYQYTKEEVQKLQALCATKTTERATLKATSVTQMWKNNLKDLTGPTG
jgi:DNA topoisomerase-2